MSTSTTAVPTFAEAVTVTALGAWPGTDPVEAAKVGLGLLSDPHLPGLASLPARGVGSDAVGRTAALLMDLPVDVQPYGWRFVDRAGLDQRRAVSALSTDINVLADVVGASELAPASFKIHLMGPLSLAAAVHLHYGERAISDYGARRDIAQSLAAGLPTLVEKIQAALPGTALTLQIDEPAIASVLAGTIPTASGYRTLRSVPAAELRQLWTAFMESARGAGFSKVAINISTSESASQLSRPVMAEAALAETERAEAAGWRKALGIALESNPDALALPLHQLDTGHWEELAAALESGLAIWAGTVPARPSQLPPSYGALVERIMLPWRSLGLDIALLNQLSITPRGSLAAVAPFEARAAVERALEVAEELTAIRFR